MNQSRVVEPPASLSNIINMQGQNIYESRTLPIGEIPLYTIDYAVWTKQSDSSGLSSLNRYACCIFRWATVECECGCAVLMNMLYGVETSASLV